MQFVIDRAHGLVKDLWVAEAAYGFGCGVLGCSGVDGAKDARDQSCGYIGEAASLQKRHDPGFDEGPLLLFPGCKIDCSVIVRFRELDPSYVQAPGLSFH